MTDRKLYLGPMTDNRRWDRLRLRPSDIIVATPPKSGTTWMQVILALLLSGDPNVEPDLASQMPWVDLRFREIGEVAQRLDAMAHRRSMKSHTPLDGLPGGAGLYICVFRHPLDAHFSYRAHLRNVPMPFFAHWYPEEDPQGVTFQRFLDGGAEGFDGDAMPLAHILRHYEAAGACARMARGKVALFHYADMWRDLPGTFDRVARLIGVTHPPARMAELVEVARFETMRAQAPRFVPLRKGAPEASARAFFDSGSSGKWAGELSAAQMSAYDAAMDAALDAEARRWLEYGAAPS